MSISLSLKSPVLILAYKRHDFLEDLLYSLPTDRNIYIHIDGPRQSSELEVAITNDVAYKFKNTNHSRSIHILSQPMNLGNLGSFLAAMQWAFAREDRLILLDDDVRFSESFFPFMDWALEKFQNLDHIFQINGLSFLDRLPGRNRLFESYSCRAWGFGTWKSRWELYKVTNLPTDPSVILQLPIFSGVHMTDSFKQKWLDRFDRLSKGTDTYDLGWNYAAWKNGACALAPRFTFTTNIGFDSRSLHTTIKPRGLRSPEKIKSRRMKYKEVSTVPFPSFYDAYSDFIEWGIPGIKKGALANLLIPPYFIIKKVKQTLNKKLFI